MKLVHLLTVDSTWHIQKAGLLALRPNFSIPEGFPSPHEEEATVRRPDGSEHKVTAQYNISHFNISDPEASIDERWRVTISLLDSTPEEVPDGSQILVSSDLAATLTNQQA